MEHIQETIQNFKPQAKASTISKYMADIKTLYKQINEPLLSKPSSMKFTYVKDIDLPLWAADNINKIMNILDKDKITTRRGKLTSLIVMLDAFLHSNPRLISLPPEQLTEALTFYRMENDKLKKQVEDHYAQAEPKTTLTWNDILHIANKHQPDPIKKLVTMLYTELPPIRLDYGNMIFIKRGTFNKLTEEQQTANNWFLYRNKNDMEIILNDFKTARSQGQKHFNVPRPIRNHIFQMKPRDNTPLLPYTQNNLGKVIKSIFGVGVSTLRSLKITHENPKEKIDANQKLADDMLHSKQVQETIYSKRGNAAPVNPQL